jgi:hypothetical protein
MYLNSGGFYPYNLPRHEYSRGADLAITIIGSALPYIAPTPFHYKKDTLNQ